MFNARNINEWFFLLIKHISKKVTVFFISNEKQKMVSYRHIDKHTAQ